MTLDDFKNLDPKEIGDWPMIVQMFMLVIIFALIVGGGWYAVWQQQIDDLNGMQQTELKLRDDFSNRKAQAVNLEAYKEQLEKIREQFGDLLKQLPTKSQMEMLLKEINEAGVGRGLVFELFKPGQEVQTSEFAELPIAIKLAGSFHDLAGFMNEVAKLSRIVTINDIDLKVRKDSILELNAVIKTYRALDETEQQDMAQKEAAAKKQRKQ